MRRSRFPGGSLLQRDGDELRGLTPCLWKQTIRAAIRSSAERSTHVMNTQRIWNTLLASGLGAALLMGACTSDRKKDGDYKPDSDADEEDDDDGMAGEGNTPDKPVPGLTGAGLKLDVTEVKVSTDGVAAVEFTLTDDQGNPLDLDGRLTLGAVSPSFVLSWLGENEAGESTQYTAYTLRDKDGESQSTTDAGGTYETVEFGRYRYTLGTKIDITDARKGKTHTVGVYATRTVGDVRYVSVDVESWVPDGSDVTTVLDVVNDQACNTCHTRLEFHGGSRRGVGLCNLCHTEENSLNPGSGNTIDFQVMIHKIHMGKNLPSVLGGDPYFFVGYMDSRIDYSEVSYPWNMKDCAKCHQGTQGGRFITRPAQKPCSSCHDRTWFGPKGEAPMGWHEHSGGPRDDSECIVCHGEDSLEPISKSHLTSLSDPNYPRVTAEILNVTETAPGATPNVEFKVAIDGTPVDLFTDPFDRIRMKIWGPNADAKGGWEETIPFTPCATVPVPPCLEAKGDGFIYHAVTPIPVDAVGSFNVGLDGRYNFTTRGPIEGDPAVYGNVPFVNPVMPVAVTDAVPMARREIVSRDTCNGCHGDLGFHGGGYRDPAYCINCHNTSATEEGEGGLTPGSSQVLAALNFKDFIHRKHKEAAYPAPLNDCAQCHLEGTYYLPLTGEDLLSSTYVVQTCPDGGAACDGMGGAPGVSTDVGYSVPPESAACTSCHNDRATLAHAETNSGMVGEACGTCHGAGKQQDVVVVHALAP